MPALCVCLLCASVAQESRQQLLSPKYGVPVTSRISSRGAAKFAAPGRNLGVIIVIGASQAWAWTAREAHPEKTREIKVCFITDPAPPLP